jgi:hypothetical protein
VDERSDERTDQQPYEPPSAEDVATDDVPSVTAAGGTKTVGAG